MDIKCSQHSKFSTFNFITLMKKTPQSKLNKEIIVVTEHNHVISETQLPFMHTDTCNVQDTEKAHIR